MGHVLWGMPVWVWCLAFGLGVGNEVINRLKFTRAQSILQGICSFALWFPGLGFVLARFPVVGDVLRLIATPPQITSAGTTAKLEIPTAKIGVGAVLALTLVGLTSLSCTAMQKDVWKTAGIAALGCAGSGVIDAAGSALVDLLSQVGEGTPVTADSAKALGEGLAIKYGTAAVECAVGKAWAVLQTAGLHGKPSPAAQLVGLLVQTHDEWSRTHPAKARTAPGGSR